MSCFHYIEDIMKHASRDIVRSPVEFCGRAAMRTAAFAIFLGALLVLAACTAQPSWSPPPPASPLAPAPDTQVPTVPTGLAGAPVSSTRIDLSWSPSTDDVGVAGYYVYVNDVALATTTTTSFMHSGLAEGTTYGYRVSAYDAASN